MSKDYKEFFRSAHGVEFSVEEMYQAFKDRFIEETEIDGNACEGVVTAKLRLKYKYRR